ncbi:hypothetical protein DRE_07269 [Drechslerella stenobrocha 248]|uniref:Uncharacterized protein n=1 Tax=Drechslerella stenobrocha 248 TaxID=1043628 RepID=W7I501_9PEZI|nr:hypothetical protein DRE_07269 [Drechslerella stenobrocha 248]
MAGMLWSAGAKLGLALAGALGEDVGDDGGGDFGDCGVEEPPDLTATEDYTAAEEPPHEEESVYGESESYYEGGEEDYSYEEGYEEGYEEEPEGEGYAYEPGKGYVYEYEPEDPGALDQTSSTYTGDTYFEQTDISQGHHGQLKSPGGQSRSLVGLAVGGAALAAGAALVANRARRRGRGAAGHPPSRGRGRGRGGAGAVAGRGRPHAQGLGGRLPVRGGIAQGPGRGGGFASGQVASSKLGRLPLRPVSYIGPPSLQDPTTPQFSNPPPSYSAVYPGGVGAAPLPTQRQRPNPAQLAQMSMRKLEALRQVQQQERERIEAQRREQQQDQQRPEKPAAAVPELEPQTLINLPPGVGKPNKKPVTATQVVNLPQQAKPRPNAVNNPSLHEIGGSGYAQTQPANPRPQASSPSAPGAQPRPNVVSNSSFHEMDGIGYTQTQQAQTQPQIPSPSSPVAQSRPNMVNNTSFHEMDGIGYTQAQQTQPQAQVPSPSAQSRPNVVNNPSFHEMDGVGYTQAQQAQPQAQVPSSPAQSRPNVMNNPSFYEMDGSGYTQTQVVNLPPSKAQQSQPQAQFPSPPAPVTQPSSAVNNSSFYEMDGSGFYEMEGSEYTRPIELPQTQARPQIPPPPAPATQSPPGAMNPSFYEMDGSGYTPVPAAQPVAAQPVTYPPPQPAAAQAWAPAVELDSARRYNATAQGRPQPVHASTWAQPGPAQAPAQLPTNGPQRTTSMLQRFPSRKPVQRPASIAVPSGAGPIASPVSQNNAVRPAPAAIENANVNANASSVQDNEEVGGWKPPPLKAVQRRRFGSGAGNPPQLETAQPPDASSSSETASAPARTATENTYVNPAFDAPPPPPTFQQEHQSAHKKGYFENAAPDTVIPGLKVRRPEHVSSPSSLPPTANAAVQAPNPGFQNQSVTHHATGSNQAAQWGPTTHETSTPTPIAASYEHARAESLSTYSTGLYNVPSKLPPPPKPPPSSFSDSPDPSARPGAFAAVELPASTGWASGQSPYDMHPMISELPEVSRRPAGGGEDLSRTAEPEASGVGGMSANQVSFGWESYY